MPARKQERFQAGEELAGRYVIEGLIGEGGVGQVYKATHKYLRTQVAIKVMHSGGDQLADAKRFEREAFALGKVAHENCMAVTDFGEADGLLFLVTEYLEGESLGDVLHREGRIPLARTFDIIAQLLRALGHAHGQGVVHRDLKPDNIILVERAGNPEFVKVLDFGLAKLKGETLREEGGGDLTRTGVTFGTPRFMAPEQATGSEVDGRTDLYAVSCIAYRMLCGKSPFDADDPLEMLMAHCTKVAPTFSEQGVDDIPGSVEAMIRRGLAKDKNDRYADAYAFLDALDECLEDPSIGIDKRTTRSLRRGGPRDPADRKEEPETAALAPTQAAVTTSPPSPKLPATAAMEPAGKRSSAPQPAQEVPYIPPGPRRRPSWVIPTVLVTVLIASIAVVAGTAGSASDSDANDEPASAKVADDDNEDVSSPAKGTAAAKGETGKAEAKPAEAKPKGLLEVVSGAADSVDYDFSETGLEDVRKLIDRGRESQALKLLRKKVKSGKYGGRAAFLAGTLYTRKMYWSDAYENYALAIKRDKTLKTHPLILSNAVAGLGSRSKPWIAERFIKRHLGKEVLPYLEKAAKNAKHEHHRERAARLAKRYR